MKSLEADDPAAAVVPESDPAAAVGPDPNPAAPVVPATDLETFLLSEELGVIMVNVFVLGLIRMLFVYIRLHLLSLLHKIISGL